jgi:hypothetical protein
MALKVESITTGKWIELAPQFIHITESSLHMKSLNLKNKFLFRSVPLKKGGNQMENLLENFEGESIRIIYVLNCCYQRKMSC